MAGVFRRRHERGHAACIRGRSERLRTFVGRILSLAVIVAGARYLWWRTSTLEGTGSLGVAFFAVEVLSFTGVMLLAIVLRRRRWRENGPGEEPRGTLDVFITVCGEPTEMVEETLLAALAISYPHRTYLLNDGAIAGKSGWREIEELAERHGVTCFTRTEGRRGKAANLNFALARTDGDFVATIDADHVAHAELAHETLGYFAHAKVAFVASHQSFASDSHDTLNNEERFFYRCVQPAKDADGCAISCGNGSVYRRTSLDEIGGFSEWNLVEDLHTSYVLHAAGWTSVYHPRPLTHGTAPLTGAEYLKQRLQWATDSLRILVFDNPLRRRGLSWRHRVHYLQTTASYLTIAAQTAFIVAPSLYLLWGVSVVNAPSIDAYLSYTVPYLGITALLLVLNAGIRGSARAVQSALFVAPVYLVAIVKAVTGLRFRSRVTNKHRQRRLSLLLIPQAAGFCMAAAAILVALQGAPRFSGVALFWCGYVGFQLAGPLLALTERQLVTQSARRIARFGVVAVAVPAFLTGAIGRSPIANDGVLALTVPPAVPGEPVIGDPIAPSEPARPRMSEKLEAPTAGAYLGVANPGLLTSTTAIDEWSVGHGHRPQLVQWFQQWHSNETRFRGDWLDVVTSQGGIPMITWEPWAKPEGGYADPDQPEARLSFIVDGTYDAYVTEWAQAAAAYGRPIVLRLMQEMNGWWYPWSVLENGNTPELFVQAWRHVHDLFDAAGAHNVSWVWSLNTSVGLRDLGVDNASFYPGEEYVDWVAFSGFNWGTVEEWSVWRSADDIFRPSYDALAVFGKPIMISEVGTVPVGGNEGAWVRDMLATMERDFPLVKAVVWYDAAYTRDVDFRLSGAAGEAVRHAVAGSAYWSVAPTTSIRREPAIPQHGAW